MRSFRVIISSFGLIVIIPTLASTTLVRSLLQRSQVPGILSACITWQRSHVVPYSSLAYVNCSVFRDIKQHYHHNATPQHWTTNTSNICLDGLIEDVLQLREKCSYFAGNMLDWLCLDFSA